MKISSRIKNLENRNLYRNRSLSLAEYIQAVKDGTYKESSSQPGVISLEEYIKQINAKVNTQPKPIIDNRPSVEIQAKEIQTEEIQTEVETELPVIERKPFAEKKERRARSWVVGNDNLDEEISPKLTRRDVLNY